MEAGKFKRVKVLQTIEEKDEDIYLDMMAKEAEKAAKLTEKPKQKNKCQGNPLINYTCISCRKKFDNMLELKKHFVGYHFCNECSTGFEHAYVQQDHIHSVHKKTKCLFCPDAFRYGGDLVDHLFSEHPSTSINVHCVWSDTNCSQHMCLYTDDGDSVAFEKHLAVHLQKRALEFIHRVGLPHNYPAVFDVELKLSDKDCKVQVVATQTNANIQRYGRYMSYNMSKSWRSYVRAKPAVMRLMRLKSFKHLTDETFSDIMKCQNKCIFYCRHCIRID